jgi:hypothetical protein
MEFPGLPGTVLGLAGTLWCGCRIIIHTEKPSFKKVVVFIFNLQIFTNGPSGRRASLPCMRMNIQKKIPKIGA